MKADPINIIRTNQNQQKKDRMKNLKDILYQENKSMDSNRFEHPTLTLATTFHKPAGEANQYVRFLYGHTQFYNTPEDKFQDQ